MQQQQNVEKLWKNLLNQRAHVVKARPSPSCPLALCSA